MNQNTVITLLRNIGPLAIVLYVTVKLTVDAGGTVNVEIEKA